MCKNRKTIFFVFIIISFISPEIKLFSNQQVDSNKQAVSYDFGGYDRCLIDGSYPQDSTQIRLIPAISTASLFVGAVVGFQFYHYEHWWKNRNLAGFYVKNDWDESLQFDKFGHFTATYLLSHIASEGMMFSGFSRNTSDLIGSGFGFLYELYIEINDGYAAPWGFSYSDIGANLVAAGFFLAQKKLKPLQYFTPKWIYIPSDFPGFSKKSNVTTFFETYNYSSFWISADVYKLLPNNAQKYWIPYINIAGGYCVRGFDTYQLRRHYLIGLDYNFAAISQLMKPSVLKWLVQSMNYIKFPAPAVEFGESTEFHLFYPFTIGLDFQF